MKFLIFRMMTNKIKLKDDYILANCCQPGLEIEITGYYSHTNIIKVHRSDCLALKKADKSRLVDLKWSDILAAAEIIPEDDFSLLEKNDFEVMKHHRAYGIDYSLMVAKMLTIPRQEAFDRHKKLKEMGLLARVDATMVRYRKGVVDNKWIKHRNHTYYALTSKGELYLRHFERQKEI